MNEETYATQLAESRAQSKSEKTAPEKAGFLKTLFKNPFVKLLIPTLGEIGSGGILPGNTGIVLWAYAEEKKSGNPNIAEYLVVGGLAATADAIGVLSLTGVLLILSYAVTLPCLGLLWFWRLHKHINKKFAPTKIKPKKS